jgi:Kelch motif.
MTDQLELNRVLGAFLATGTDELADRVIDAALNQIDHTPQRRALRAPWRFQTMTMFTRVAAAAVIGVIAIGGAYYLLRPSQPTVGSPTPTPAITSRPSAVAPTAAATPTAAPLLTGPMGVGRQIHSAALLADGRVLLAGGFDGHDTALASGSIYDPITRTFSLTGNMADARGLLTSTTLQDGRVLMAGGGVVNWTAAAGVPFLTTAELFDPATGTFTTTGSMSTAREGHTATLLLDGRVLIAGGTNVINNALTSAEIYDPKTGKFSPTGSMFSPRAFHAAALLEDGRVLITGGTTGTWDSGAGATSAEVFNPKTGAFSATGSMTIGRAWHTATLLLDGRVLLTGGTTSSNQNAAELYDPKTGTFAATGSMTIGRLYHTAMLLQDGRVLVVGGGGDYANANFLASAEIWDPKTRTFTATGSLGATRTYHTATRLTDGRVLVTGGYSATGPLPTGEIFDPKTGLFSPAS